MPNIGEAHPSRPDLMWDGSGWSSRTKMGAGKSGAQAASDLGFKGKTAAAAGAVDKGTNSLADIAARRRKQMEETAKAVEDEAKRKKKER